MTIAEALREVADALAQAGVPSPRVDAELLVGHALGVTRTTLYSARDRALANGEGELLGSFVARRVRREPLAYILGEWGFRRLTLKTDARALVPRPETEIVVERCLALLADLEREPGIQTGSPRVLDVGVGTGAIALAIADEYPSAQVTAVDTSADALDLARENAERTGLAVELRAGGFEVAAEGWDLVVSNPPYVRSDQIGRLEPEVRDWEPRRALVGTGLHEELARIARTSRLVLEVADDQAPDIARALEATGYEAVRITPDLAGRERVVEGKRP